MSNPKPTTPRSLMSSVLLRIVFAAALLVSAFTALAYSYMHREMQTQLLENLSDWVVERARNDSVVFELAQENLERFSNEFLRLYTSDIEVSETEFWSFYKRDEDNAVRMKPEFYDGAYTKDGLYFEGVSSFIGNNQSVDNPDLQRRLVLSSKLLAQLGPAWISRFQNTHVTFPENAIALHAPGMPWGLEAEPDLPMNELSVVRSMQQSENPQRKPLWSGLYFDETAQEWALTYQVPLDFNGKHLLNPSHDVSLTQMMNKLANDTHDGGYNLIFRSDGYLIAQPAPPASDRRWVGQLSLDKIENPEVVRMYELINAATLESPGTASLVRNTVDDTWLAVSELTGPGWWFVSVYPGALIRAHAGQAAVAVLVSGIVLLLLLIAIIRFIIRRDAEKPLEQLREAARQVKQGDYASVAEGRVELPRELRNEVGLLANTFHSMSVSIRDAHASLEQAVAERTKELEDANNSLLELSLHDALLGIYNRRAFENDLAHIMTDARLGYGNLHLMLIDVDHFKLFNDSYGHIQGDEVLKKIASTIAGTIRSEDRVYRYGGEELAVFFNRSSAEEAKMAAQRVMKSIEGLAIDFPESEHGIVTISAGLVHCHAHHSSINDIVADADALMYESKNKGRNRLTSS